MRNDHRRAKREEVSGWSAKTARSNTRFLQSVKLDSLSGTGVAFTLTLKNCPDTADDWNKLRKAFTMRLQRAGMARLHWVTEWQRRGVPHLHGVVYFPDMPENECCGMIVNHWLKVAESYVAAPWAQNAKPITSSLGWLQYLAKHASRGAGHYQRSRESIPLGWKEKTGRMWGKWGQWETGDPSKFQVNMPAFHAYRRVFRRYRISESRAAGDWRSLKYSRRCLKSNLQSLSTVRGTSGWIPEQAHMAMVHWLAAAGYTVEST
jgi:hypothetical protein